jgi:hypothetical protein
VKMAVIGLVHGQTVLVSDLRTTVHTNLHNENQSDNYRK